ncbi:MAG TPA: hypothetical protein PLU22_11030, partial [Polyangiaceae bacterium]|nr:hypothetical protein [Polyangiaceae bacterium]
ALGQGPRARSASEHAPRTHRIPPGGSKAACDQGIVDECDMMDSPQWNDPEENPDEFTSLQEAAQEVLGTGQRWERFRDTGEDWGVAH